MAEVRVTEINEMKKPAYSLQEAAIRFIQKTCTELRYDIEKKEESEGKICTGKSLRQNQIPYNMEMDLDRLCFTKAIQRFLESGIAVDAFDVYFCYMEMFVGSYKKTREMVELLSEFETNGSSLLMKHRDHYVHSVYVFILGLAIYETNRVFRETYKNFYEEEIGSENEKDLAHHFMKYWGLSALFHDIGYPMELPYEQMLSYFEIQGTQRAELPYLAYNRLENYQRISPELQKQIAILYGNNSEEFSDTNVLFGYDIEQKLGKTYSLKPGSMATILKNKPEHPEEYDNFMDHAYFSATILFRRLYDELGCVITKSDIDAMTAIILHNSLYKFKIAFYKKRETNKPLEMRLHPLAYMLMLCDELQCWDRTSYGRRSRGEAHPVSCEFEFAENSISACYVFDKTDDRKTKFEADAFLGDIGTIIQAQPLDLTITKRYDMPERSRKHIYLSDSNFLNLYHFAVSLNGCYDLVEEGEAEWEKKLAAMERDDLKETFEERFNSLSLEYKLSNINQAKGFDKYLNAIGAFYTDRPVDFPLLDYFTEQEESTIGSMEHERWLREKIGMGWKYGIVNDSGLTKDEKKNRRENARIHPDMIPDGMWDGKELTRENAIANYERLSGAEQQKDITPMNAMLLLLKLYGGARVYRRTDSIESHMEQFAEAVHNRWMEQKRIQGYRPGDKIDREKKIDSRICPYDQLSEEEKEFDRATARAVLKTLREMEY